MAEYTSEEIAGFTLLAVGALLIVVAIILLIVVLVRRGKGKDVSRAPSPDTFKVVYKVPTANGVTTKVASDVYDGKSTHTIRSEPGYTYVAPRQPIPQTLVMAAPQTQPLMVAGPPSPQPIVMAAPVTTAATLPRAVSVDQLTHSMPRAGYRYVVPQQNAGATLPRVLIPISKKQAKKMRKRRSKPLYVPAYGNGTAGYGTHSLISAPAYATSARSAPTTRPTKYYLYGSTPNLHANQFTQPVLMYDKTKRMYTANEVSGGAHNQVHNWLNHEEPVSFPAEDNTDYPRPLSRASSAPTDLDLIGTERGSHLVNDGLYLRWSPRMRRKLEEKDRRERANSERASSSLPRDGMRSYHHYTEVTESF